jgi:hypothetical protein
MEEKLIREPEIKRDEQGNIIYVAIAFGPHYFVEIMPDENSGELTLYLGTTHHGFHATAIELNGQLEKLIDEVKLAHPALEF